MTFSTFAHALLLVAVSFMLGLVVGEGWAPISGNTTMSLTTKANALDARIEVLASKYEELNALCRDAGSEASRRE